MTSGSTVEGGGANRPAAPAAAHWLVLAASPTFAAMAWISAKAASDMAFCAPASLPVDGMTAMYLLMSLFHLSPWLGLAGRARAGSRTITKGE